MIWLVIPEGGPIFRPEGSSAYRRPVGDLVLHKLAHAISHPTVLCYTLNCSEEKEFTCLYFTQLYRVENCTALQLAMFATIVSPQVEHTNSYLWKYSHWYTDLLCLHLKYQHSWKSAKLKTCKSLRQLSTKSAKSKICKSLKQLYTKCKIGNMQKFETSKKVDDVSEPSLLETGLAALHQSAKLFAQHTYTFLRKVIFAPKHSAESCNRYFFAPRKIQKL